MDNWTFVDHLNDSAVWILVLAFMAVVGGLKYQKSRGGAVLWRQETHGAAGGTLHPR
jgi:hypothetical protein